MSADTVQAQASWQYEFKLSYIAFSGESEANGIVAHTWQFSNYEYASCISANRHAISCFTYDVYTYVLSLPIYPIQLLVQTVDMIITFRMSRCILESKSTIEEFELFD